MTSYNVDITVSVEAENEREAISKARSDIYNGFGEAAAFEDE